MLKVITIAQQKGGAGKTTVAAHIAVSLSQTGKRIAIIDIDPQGSLTNWYALREKKFGLGYTGLNFISSAGWRVESVINNLKDDCDYAIIDAPPHTETESKSAIRLSDLVIVPMQPSPTDLWATSITTDFAANENISVKVLFNRYNPKTKLTKEIIKQIKEDVFKNHFGNRVAFSSCFLTGVTVTENAPSSQAAREVRDFTKEVIQLFKQNQINEIEKSTSVKKRSIAKA